VTKLSIAYLADHPEAVPVLAEWFAREWGGLDPRDTVEGFCERLPSRANRDRLPICLLGLVNGEPVATATLKFREIEYAPTADFWLGSVYVREDARGRGHGRTIVAAAEAAAAAKRFAPLYLYTPRKEALYRRLGWRTAGATIADGKRATVMSRQAG
jgi:GNAT superfamily N-acetyltransferase